jgi:hypothetical protein
MFQFQYIHRRHAGLLLRDYELQKFLPLYGLINQKIFGKKRHHLPQKRTYHLPQGLFFFVLGTLLEFNTHAQPVWFYYFKQFEKIVNGIDYK